MLHLKNGTFNTKDGTFNPGCIKDKPNLTYNYPTDVDVAQINIEDEVSSIPQVNAIFEFMKHILPIKTVRHYMYTVFASVLCNNSRKKDRFLVWVGQNDSGMYELLNLYERTLGDYSAKLPSESLQHSVRFCYVTGNIGGHRLADIVKPFLCTDTLCSPKVYSMPYNIPIITLSFLCDKVPKISSDGVLRRMVIANFNSSISTVPVLSHEMFFVILFLWHKTHQPPELSPPPEMRAGDDNRETYKDFFDTYRRGDNKKETYTLFKEWYTEKFSQKAPSFRDFIRNSILCPAYY